MGMRLGPIIVLPEYDSSFIVREVVVACLRISALFTLTPARVR
jgi:hypothetical protein